MKFSTSWLRSPPGNSPALQRWATTMHLSPSSPATRDERSFRPSGTSTTEGALFPALKRWAIFGHSADACAKPREDKQMAANDHWDHEGRQ